MKQTLIQQEIASIKRRNERVELDKLWETSWARRGIIAVFTYLTIVLFFLAAGLPRPFVNPIVPTVGFVLSTLSLPYFKRLWVERQHR